jgi:uncharacterized damage-inducible protein DinB
MANDGRPDWSRRPETGECAPYYDRYISQVRAGDLLATLEHDGRALVEQLRAIPEARETHAYAPDKWTIRGLVGHVIDTERVFTGRALWFARGAPTPLPGFEENDWARVSNADRRPLRELADELDAVRRSTVHFLRGCEAATLDRRGVANGLECTVRAAAWIIAGHALHHRRILEERYLG